MAALENMELQRFDDPPPPRRWPWLLAGLTLTAGLIYIVVRALNGPDDRAPATESTTEESALTPAPLVVSTPPVEPPPPEPAPASIPAAQPSPPAAAPANIPSPTAQATDLAAAEAAEAAGQWGQARTHYLALLPHITDPTSRLAIEDRLGALNTRLAFSSQAMPEKTEHVIKAGDLLERVARKYGTTVELLQRSHGITDPRRIKIGDRLQVLTGRFRIETSKSRREVRLYLNDTFFKRYLVGIGKEDRTPVGTFVVDDRIRHPAWWRPDGKEIPYGNPENILGTHWLSLKATGTTPAYRGYGIHGTWDEASIGKAESAGCIRMRNTEVEELFALIPLGTPVTITE